MLSLLHGYDSCVLYLVLRPWRATVFSTPPTQEACSLTSLLTFAALGQLLDHEICRSMNGVTSLNLPANKLRDIAAGAASRAAWRRATMHVAATAAAATGGTGPVAVGPVLRRRRQRRRRSRARTRSVRRSWPWVGPCTPSTDQQARCCAGFAASPQQPHSGQLVSTCSTLGGGYSIFHKQLSQAAARVSEACNSETTLRVGCRRHSGGPAGAG